MNAATAKKQFSQINLAALPADLKDEVVRFKQESKNFSTGIDEEKEIYSNWVELFDIVKSAFPGAISKEMPMKPVVKSTTKKTAKTKVVKAPKVKAEKKPKVNKREEAQKEKLAKLNAQVAQYKKQLKESDTTKMQIAKLAREEYAKIAQLGSTKLEADIQKAEIQRRLYKRFLATDKRKFKSITEKTAGKGSLGRPKVKAKRKPAAKAQVKTSTKKKSIFDRIFG